MKRKDFLRSLMAVPFLGALIKPEAVAKQTPPAVLKKHLVTKRLDGVPLSDIIRIPANQMGHVGYVDGIDMKYYGVNNGDLSFKNPWIPSGMDPKDAFCFEGKGNPQTFNIAKTEE